MKGESYILETYRTFLVNQQQKLFNCDFYVTHARCFIV